MKIEIRALLCIATVFIVGDVWWCEDCGGGGFAPYHPRAHRRGCSLSDELE